ncbi:MAG: hypothetical protein ACO1NW_17835 [Chitinophagaceae bacterium]
MPLFPHRKRNAIVLFVLLVACNKNTDQLPPKQVKPQELVKPALINGVQEVDFLFYKTTVPGSDTVWLKIRNNTPNALTSLRYVVEVCKAVPQHFDNCDLQITADLPGSLAAGETSEKLFQWVNKGISLDSTLINTGVISYSGLPLHPMANVYHNIYAAFETAPGQTGYFGLVRGYVLADGTGLFRLKGKNNELLNAAGYFPQTLAYEGLLKKDTEVISPFSLDSVEVNGTKLLFDTANQRFHFRLGLTAPLNDTIHSISIFTQRNY